MTFNHEMFIATAIESFLAQRANFSYEIIIHDDASTDRTPDIIEHYAAKYVEQIYSIRQCVYQYRRGKRPARVLLEAARGEYVAFCEGDDYWTDPMKLQKQVDFLDSHSGFTICFHGTRILDERSLASPELKRRNGIYGSLAGKPPEQLGFTELLNGGNYFIHTSSAMIVSSTVQNLPKWYDTVPYGDLPLFLIATSGGGLVGRLDEVMSVYRLHSGGVHSCHFDSPAGLAKINWQNYRFWTLLQHVGFLAPSQSRPLRTHAIEETLRLSKESENLSLYTLALASYLRLSRSSARSHVWEHFVFLGRMIHAAFLRALKRWFVWKP